MNGSEHTKAGHHGSPESGGSADELSKNIFSTQTGEIDWESQTGKPELISEVACDHRSEDDHECGAVYSMNFGNVTKCTSFGSAREVAGNETLDKEALFSPPTIPGIRNPYARVDPPDRYARGWGTSAGGGPRSSPGAGFERSGEIRKWREVINAVQAMGAAAI
ncbi:hypothetical protein K438DRAFT_1784831 [Mycena galopus ATCC 62051]|nr:hypothetical protein K438DRAFT_1784831 [Mycena galopus ATCC 62051]